MKRKFLSLILAISMLPAPIASYAKDDNKCKEELELCTAANKDLYYNLSNCVTNTDKCLDIVESYKNYSNECFDTLKSFKNHSNECLDTLKSWSIEISIYRALLLMFFGSKFVNFVRNFRAHNRPYLL